MKEGDTLSLYSQSSDRIDGRDYSYSRICIVGHTLANDKEVIRAAEWYNIPVLFSETGFEYLQEEFIHETVFILDEFEGATYERLKERKALILGPPALIQCMERNMVFPAKGRPIYTLSMYSYILLFTGFKSKTELCELLNLVHAMGASVRDKASTSATHCVAESVLGDKYKYCSAFKIPIVKKDWIYKAWERRKERLLPITDESVNQLKLEALKGCKVAFLGFSEDEEKHIVEIAVKNGARVVSISHPSYHYLVVDDSNSSLEIPTGINPKTSIVKSEWFWASIQDTICLEGKTYLYRKPENCLSPQKTQLTPTYPLTSAKKRKRLKESLAHQLALEASQDDIDPLAPEILYHKRRSSGAANTSVGVLDLTPSPERSGMDTPGDPKPELKSMSRRHQVCWELLQTETNYVSILHTIMTLFKAPLENPEYGGEPLLDPTEIKIIFGNVPPIYEVHQSFQKALASLLRNWDENHSIGEAILKHKNDFARSYPPFVNYFEKTKETLMQCDSEKPRFHAFLKRCQTKPECGRQSLVELLIRPVQRLGSVILLLKEILKHTPKNNLDSQNLEKAVAALNEVMLNINEGKRKTESQVIMFDIFNDIENCPPNLLSGHRHFIMSIDTVEIGDYFGKKGDILTLFLFSDVIEVGKRRGKAAVTSKSPGTTGTLSKAYQKSFKHIHMISLLDVKRIIDVTDAEEFKDVFSFVVRFPSETKETLLTFAMVPVENQKSEFLFKVSKCLARTLNKADYKMLLVKMEPHELALEASDHANTLSKALKYAYKTGEKLGRALSFGKTATPSRRTLTRAVSSIISPLKSMTVPSSPLEGLRLASSSDLSDLEAGAMPPPPSNVFFTPSTGRKQFKSSSLGVSSSKHL